MGDTAIDFFLETLKQLITSSKLDSIICAKHELQSLEEEIKCLRGFLKVTEKKRNEHPEVMKVVMEIRDVVSEAENVVERSVIDAFKADHLTFGTKKRKAEDDLSLGLECVKEEIKTLKAKVKLIYNEDIYDVWGVAAKKIMQSSTRSGGIGGSSSARGSNTSKVVKEKVVVGFKEEVKRLIEMFEDRGEGRPLEIVTIIGAGGGGKTTLAKEVYDHPFTSHAFEICAWVNVSQDYDKTTMKRDLLICVLKSAFPQNQEDYEKSSEDMLGEKLLKCLKGRKYLIVVDDIWGIEAWNDIQRSCPRERKGSKVLFTSRQPVQLDCVLHYLHPLPIHQSWELLQKKVFGMNCCPPELVNIGMQIAEKCEGLPLAIVTIAGILATEDKTIDVWENIVVDLSSIIAKNKESGCMEILELSYNHLPLHLKACFLYIGAFLEDSEIRVRELLWLWVAEGFIQPSEGGESLEDVAKGHLINLIDRSLVMIARKSSLGGIKACRIHDLLRVFCLKKAEEDNFLVQIHEDDSFSPATNKHRRLVVGYQFFDRFSLALRAQSHHSFLCFRFPSYWEFALEQSISFFAENFERLRVLSFISAEYVVPIQRGHLVHLRYLSIRISKSSEVGIESISNLLNLETLDLDTEETCECIQLPCDIFNMVKLRHLYVKNGYFQYHFSSEETARFGFDHSSKLDNLQTLHTMCACKDCLSFLERTPNLRKLGLEADIEDDMRPIPDLEFLNYVETLSLALFTHAAGMKLPLTVKRLTLNFTMLKWEELSLLRNLPSLEVLKLIGDHCCVGQAWNTNEEGFPQLKYLSFKYMRDIEEWNACEDQFPRLEFLVLQECDRLGRIPIDFTYLNELREIKLIGCTPSAEKSAREIQEEQRDRKGDDYCPNLIVKPSFQYD